MPSDEQVAAWRRYVYDATPIEIAACMEIMVRFGRREYPADMIRAYRAGRASRRAEVMTTTELAALLNTTLPVPNPDGG